jgi:hypothetical protein
MRRLRIAAPSQLSLTLSSSVVPSGPQVWALLPDVARQQVLVLLARLIARGVIADDDTEEPTR